MDAFDLGYEGSRSQLTCLALAEYDVKHVEVLGQSNDMPNASQLVHTNTHVRWR